MPNAKVGNIILELSQEECIILCDHFTKKDTYENHPFLDRDQHDFIRDIDNKLKNFLDLTLKCALGVNIPIIEISLEPSSAYALSNLIHTNSFLHHEKYLNGISKEDWSIIHPLHHKIRKITGK